MFVSYQIFLCVLSIRGELAWCARCRTHHFEKPPLEQARCLSYCLKVLVVIVKTVLEPGSRRGGWRVDGGKVTVVAELCLILLYSSSVMSVLE